VRKKFGLELQEEVQYVGFPTPPRPAELRNML